MGNTNNFAGGGILLRRRMMMSESVEYNPKYVNDLGTVYHKYEIYEGKKCTTKYRNCENMETFESPNCVYSNPYETVGYMFTGCNNLKSIKMPVANALGHYVFSGLPKLEYIELGSIGHAFYEGGYFRRDKEIGTDAGLTLVAYMNEYSSSAGFMGRVADNTTIIIRNAVTGEIMTE